MSGRLHPRLVVAAALFVVAATAVADTSLEVYKSLGIAHRDVLNGTVLTAQVLPGEEKQIVSLVTYFTGSRDEANAVNVRLDVLRREQDRLESLFSRDYGKENGGHVGRGDLELVDLDGDGLKEIVVTFDNLKDRLIRERRGEVLVHDSTGFRAAWSGAMEWDATRAAREVPLDRRDRFSRRLDVPATLRTRGVSLVLSKSMIAVAGEKLPSPRVVTEAFPLREAGTR